MSSILTLNAEVAIAYYGAAGSLATGYQKCRSHPKVCECARLGNDWRRLALVLVTALLTSLPARVKGDVISQLCSGYHVLIAVAVNWPSALLLLLLLLLLFNAVLNYNIEYNST
jgi:hypothetical protein